MSKNRVIGNQGKIPWRISDDFTHFKNLTSGKTLIMGRKTYESLPSPLNDRTVIVVSKSSGLKVDKLDNRENDTSEKEEFMFVDSIEKALEVAKKTKGSQEIFIGGGGEIYKQTINLVNKIYLTVIEAEVEGDTFFPEFDISEWNLASSRKRYAQVLDQSVIYRFEEWVR